MRQSLNIKAANSSTAVKTRIDAITANVSPLPEATEETPTSLDPQKSPNSEYGKVEDNDGDEDKKYENTGGININAVHRAVLRGSIVKLPGKDIRFIWKQFTFKDPWFLLKA